MARRAPSKAKSSSTKSTFSPFARHDLDQRTVPGANCWSPNSAWLMEYEEQTVETPSRVICYECATGRVVLDRAVNERAWWSGPDELSLYTADEERFRIATRVLPDGGEVGAFEVKPYEKRIANSYISPPERGSGRYVVVNCSETQSSLAPWRWLLVDIVERRVILDSMSTDENGLHGGGVGQFHPDGGSLVFFQPQMGRLTWLGFDGNELGRYDLPHDLSRLRVDFYWIGPTHLFVFPSRTPSGKPQRRRVAIIDFNGTSEEHELDPSTFEDAVISPGGMRMLLAETSLSSVRTSPLRHRWRSIDLQTFEGLELRPYRRQGTHAQLDWCGDDTLIEMVHKGKGRFAFARRSAETGKVEAAGEWNTPRAIGRIWTLRGTLSPCTRYYYLRCIASEGGFGAWFDLTTMPASHSV